MSSDAECDAFVEEVKISLATPELSREWARQTIETKRGVRERLKATHATLAALQDEYKKLEHNYQISQRMVVKLAEYVKKYPVMDLYEALEEPPVDLFEKCEPKQ
jgi:hypothetical protein